MSSIAIASLIALSLSLFPTGAVARDEYPRAARSVDTIRTTRSIETLREQNKVTKNTNTVTVTSKKTATANIPVKKVAATPVPKQSTTPAPQTQPAQTPIQTASQSDFITAVERDVLRFTNEERAKHGLSSLSHDAALARVARAHSADMLAKNYFSHTNTQGCSSSCRVTNAGYEWKAVAENIHWMSGYNLSATETAKKIVTDWMNSPPHRATILNGTYTKAGTGIAQSGSKIYTTSNYALPR